MCICIYSICRLSFRNKSELCSIYATKWMNLENILDVKVQTLSDFRYVKYLV